MQTSLIPSVDSYLRPATLDDALAALARGPAVVLAGGTDLYPAAEGPRLAGRVVDVSGIAALRGIAHDAGGIRIGACASWADIARAALPPACAGLQAAALLVGGRQVQTAGTIGGNLCNASPAADGVPPLLTLGAEVELVGPAGLRRLGLADFILGPRRTARGPAEIVTAVHLPAAALGGRGAFLKHGARVHLVISIVSVAVRIVLDGGRVAEAAVAVGAASAVPRRLASVEAALIGRAAAEATRAVDPAAVGVALAPLDDIRATAAHRSAAAAELLRRAVGDLCAQGGQP
jgi:CO/xanthine dehydrogenase FAD-binding subunit